MGCVYRVSSFIHPFGQKMLNFQWATSALGLEASTVKMPSWKRSTFVKGQQQNFALVVSVLKKEIR